MKPVLVGAFAPLALAALALVPAPTRAEEAAPAVRKFSFTYAAKVPAPAADAKRLDVWIPLPLEDDLQKVSDVKIEAKVGDKVVPYEETKDATYGNRMVHVGLDAPKGELAVSWTATITRTEDRGQGTGPMNERFTQADNKVPLTGKATVLAKELGADKADASVRDRAKKVYDNVLATMTYDKVAPGWGKGDFDRACEVGKGNCTDFHAKFTGIARAGGIPVRFTMGIPLSTNPKENKPSGYHCWAHFSEGKNWIPVDISEAQKINAKDPAKAQWFFGHLDPDRVALTVGRDLTLAPKQAGDPLLFFAYPYAEVDGKPVEWPKDNSHRSFAWESK
jgi:transglutaminase-like putative cysteine protease